MTSPENERDKLQIRCSKARAIEFRQFAQPYDTQEEALADLMAVAEEYPNLLSHPYYSDK